MTRYILTAWLALGVSASTLSPAQIQSAIAEGVKYKARAHEIGARVNGADGGFNIAVRGPENRIAFAAAFAAGQYRPFTVADVTADMLAPTITILAVPKPPVVRPYGGLMVTPPATNLVINAKSGIVQPKAFTHAPMAWTNALGGTFSGVGIQAEFDPATLPTGDLEIVVATHDGGRRYTVKAKDRAKVR